MTQVYELFIRTTPEKLWQALTDGEVTKKYFYGETFHAELKPGGEWHSMGPSGNRDVEGKVLECEPRKRLVITWHILYDAELSKELSKVTYELEPRGELCRLRVTHDVSEAPRTAPHVGGGWPLIVSSLKSLLETGKALPMEAA